MDALTAIKSNVVVPVIELLFALALIVFLWGVVQYIININSPSGRKDGQQHMFWGLIGLAIMLAAFGIMNFIWNTVHPNGTTGIQGADITKPTIVNQGHF